MLAPSSASLCSATLPTPGSRPTGSGSRNAAGPRDACQPVKGVPGIVPPVSTMFVVGRKNATMNASHAVMITVTGRWRRMRIRFMQYAQKLSHGGNKSKSELVGDARSAARRFRNGLWSAASDATNQAILSRQ